MAQIRMVDSWVRYPGAPASQYRSVIFCHTPEQEAAARASLELEQVSGRHCRPIVTEVTPASTFWRAEEYHQQYLAKRGLSNCPI